MAERIVKCKDMDKQDEIDTAYVNQRKFNQHGHIPHARFGAHIMGDIKIQFLWPKVST